MHKPLQLRLNFYSYFISLEEDLDYLRAQRMQ